jgi:hypothetical protein
VAHVRSELKDPALAPNQGDEGAPAARLVFTAVLAPALAGLAVGDEVMLLSWLDQADRDVLRVHPRGDTSRPQQGEAHRGNADGAALFPSLALQFVHRPVMSHFPIDRRDRLDFRKPLEC